MKLAQAKAFPKLMIDITKRLFIKGLLIIDIKKD